MSKHTGFSAGFFALCTLILLLLGSPGLVQAKYIGGEPPCHCRECEIQATCPYIPGSSATSLSEGNLQEQASVSRLRSATGPTLNLSLTYNSYNADGSRAQVDTVLGYGWTHAYNIFLFSQRGHMFRMDGDGRVTKYQLGPGGTFTPGLGYFETLVKNADGSFTLRQKNGTVFTFAQVPNTPFLVGGPVYRLTRLADRHINVTTLSYTNGNLTSITDTYGRSLILTYNGQKKLTAITDPLGRTTTLTYDATGRRLVSITDAEGKSIQYRYNLIHQLTGKVDKDGRTFSYIYSGQGQPVAIRDGAGTTLYSLTNTQNWATDSTALARDLLRVYLPATTSKTDGRGNLGQPRPGHRPQQQCHPL